MQDTSPHPAGRRAMTGAGARTVVALDISDRLATGRARDRVGDFLPADFVDAQDRFDRTLAIVAERATGVLKTWDFVGDLSRPLIGNVSNEDIRLAELVITTGSNASRQVAATARRVRDQSRGAPDSVQYDLPDEFDLDLADRICYENLKNNDRVDSYLSGVIKSRAAERSLFVIARRRRFRGEKLPFRGVVTTAISPDYFSDSTPAWQKRRATRSASFARMGLSSPGIRRFPKRHAVASIRTAGCGDPPRRQTCRD